MRIRSKKCVYCKKRYAFVFTFFIELFAKIEALPLRWRCAEGAVHHAGNVREEQHPYTRGATKQ